MGRGRAVKPGVKARHTDTILKAWHNVVEITSMSVFVLSCLKMASFKFCIFVFVPMYPGDRKVSRGSEKMIIC
jgi:hypothetical protein